MPLFETGPVYYPDEISSPVAVEIGEPSSDLIRKIEEMESIGDNGYPINSIGEQ